MPRSRVLRCRALLAGLAALLALLLPGAVGAAWTTNLVQLDNGTCSVNLQVGADKTASLSNRPTFWIMGDGGLSRYEAFIDGASIGTFLSAGNANVCVPAAAPLADGPHLFTALELAPRPVMLVTPFAFSVDTAAPAPPSAAVLSAFTDSGTIGDGVTKYRNVNFTGTSSPSLSIQLFNGTQGLGGAKADGEGNWSATTTPLADGVYTVTAAAFDSAGNKSVLSQPTRLTVDSVAPATPVAPTALDHAADTPSRVVAGISTGDVASIRLFSDGTQIGSVATPGRRHNWRFTLPPLTAGSHTIAVAAADRADNITPLSTALSVTVNPAPGDPPPPASPPTAESESRPAPPELPRLERRRPPGP